MTKNKRNNRKIKRKYSFLAIDFETANYNRNSACAIGLVKVVNNDIVFSDAYLIKPPTRYFAFTYLHGISWEDVKQEPNFKKLWPLISHHFDNVDFLVAHNATFDKSVLHACCDYYGIKYLTNNFKCTMKIARELWNIYPTGLSDVCSNFKIKLNHHDALSDTLACAQIMVKALNNRNYIIQ